MEESLRQRIEIKVAPESEKHILHNLLQYHAHDMSEFCDEEVNADGQFEYDGSIRLNDYWIDDKRHPFIVWIAGKPAGFAVMLEEEFDDGGGCFFMVDFFILKSHRRQGVGEYVAHSLFDQFQGRWQISEVELNLPAQAFWRKIISRYKQGEYEEELLEDGCVMQIFDSSL
jgi:predicted acetyltransferase